MSEAIQKRLIYGIIVFAISGLLVFVYTIFNYFRFSHIHFQADIDKDYFGVFGEFIGGVVGTIFNIITAILVYITYSAQQKEVLDTKRLLQKQIDLSVKPDLYFPNALVYGYANGQEEDKGDYATDFSNMTSMPAEEAHYGVNVDLINVGVGVAKNIEFYWEFDLDEIQQYLNNQFNNNPLILDSIDKNFVEFKMAGLKNSIYLGQTFYKLKRRFDVLLSYKENSQKIAVLFPMPYLMTYFVAIKLSITNKNDKLDSFMSLDDFPKCCLYMSYSDISDKKHQKTFQFKFSGHGAFTLKGSKGIPIFGYDIYANEIL